MGVTGLITTRFQYSERVLAVSPFPPDDLMIRVGVSPEAFPTRAVRETFFADAGRAVHQCIRDVIPHQEGQRILDFGCGSGRMLRWFASEPNVHLTACDIHRPSIEWMQANFASAVRLYASDPAPPLPESDETFDLVYCSSVFSHLTDWAPWLLELRRVLKPGGILVASLHGRGFWDLGFHGAHGAPWDEDSTGILVEQYGDKFDDSWGPAVYVSEWWVREHWGRALDIERFEPTGFGQPDNPSTGQAWLVARKRTSTQPLAPADLESPSTDPRETAAAIRGQRLAYEEVEHLTSYVRSIIHRQAGATPKTKAEGSPTNSLLTEAQEQKRALEAQVADLSRRLVILENSRSWNMTRPMRAIAQKLRASRQPKSV